MPGRSYTGSSYRFGFNGQEKDDEVSGSGNSMTAEFWQYDSRLCRRWNVDPLSYEWQSSYSVFNNNPIYFNDPFGLQGEGPDPANPNGTAGGPQNGETCSNPDGTGEYFANGNWHQSSIQGRQLNDVDITTPRQNGATPPQEYGNVWKTDRGGESIWPVGTEPGGNGWSFVKGPDFFRTKGRTNMVQTIHDYGDMAGLFKPQTKNDLLVNDAIQTGGRDAVIGFGAATAAPFAVGYGSAAIGFANQRLAMWYLSRIGQLGNFSSVTGFSVGFGNVSYRYAPTLSNAFGRWSTSVNYTAQEAYIYLALNYPGSIHTMNNLQFQLMRFGIYVNGIAAPQGGLGNGGGQQFMRVIGTDVITK